MSADAYASKSAGLNGLCRVGIVGGGMLGMTLALRLRDLGCDVTLIEAAPTAGGLVQSQTIGGYTWDRFYHVTLLSDQHLHALLDELGLAPLLRWGTTRTGFYTDGRLRSLSVSSGWTPRRGGWPAWAPRWCGSWSRTVSTITRSR